MREKQYFCYEKSLRGWSPVVYHGSPPSKSINGQGPERSTHYEVPDDCVDVVGEPLFFRLIQKFPAPAPVTDNAA